ncbi:hypothetical protein EMIT040CA3_310138 [Bacillus pseudomycoides]
MKSLLSFLGTIIFLATPLMFTSFISLDEIIKNSYNSIYTFIILRKGR